MDRKRRVTLTVTLLALTVLGVVIGMYYYGFWTTQKQVDVSIQKNDFLLQVSLDKTEYKPGELITINYDLKHLGNSSIDFYTIASCPYVISIKNATESLDIVPGDITSYELNHLDPGQSLSGSAVMTGGIVKCYTKYPSSSFGGYGPSSGDFSPGGTYWIQFKMSLLEQYSSRSWNRTSYINNRD